jgi:rod shape-determining protein MreC
VEIKNKKEANNQTKTESNNLRNKAISTTELIKLDLLNDQVKILDESNSRFIRENQLLKSTIDELNNKIFVSQGEAEDKKKKTIQNDIDKKELEFLKLNLIYSSKCLRTVFKKGYKVGTPEYKECILRKGKKSND